MLSLILACSLGQSCASGQCAAPQYRPAVVYQRPAYVYTQVAGSYDGTTTRLYVNGTQAQACAGGRCPAPQRRGLFGRLRGR